MKTNSQFLHRFPLFALLLGLVLALSVRSALSASSTPPDLMSYQGHLLDASGAPLASSTPANYPIVFRIYDASTGGAILWSEDQTVTVDKGNFSVVLGQGTAVSGESRPALSTLFAGATASDRYLGITVTIGGTPMTISPRLRLLPSASAFAANKAITATTLANSSGANLINTSGGNVGIGTAAPSTLLQIGEGANVGTGGLKINTGWVNASDPTEARPFEVQVRGIPHLVVNTQGNVGINTANPSAKLHLNGSMKIEGTQTLEFGSGATKMGAAGTIGYNTYSAAGTEALHIVGAGTTAMNIRSIRLWDHVGIGTDAPSVPLHVNSFANISTTLSYYFDGFGGVFHWGAGTGSNPHTGNYSAIFSGPIQAGGFYAISDSRIKEVSKRTSGQDSLDAIRKLEITDYTYIDKIGRGPRQQRGLIAQEVEKVMPEVVSQGTEFVPDIYAPAASLSFDAASKALTIELRKPHTLASNDVVSLIMEDGKRETKVLATPSPTRFVVAAEKNPGRVFVFGKQVKDFRTVDYDHVFSTGISAIQELDRQVQALQKSEARLAELEQKTARMAELEAKASQVDTLEKRVLELEGVQQQMAELRKLVSELASAAPKASRSGRIGGVQGGGRLGKSVIQPQRMP